MTQKKEPLHVTSGCLFATCSAMVTAIMLLLNGSLVMAVLTSLEKNEVPLVSNLKFSQFLLFTVPVLLAIGQWMLVDYVRTRLMRRT